MRKLAALSVLAGMVFITGNTTSPAHAKSSRVEKLSAKKAYYHADGYIKAIGKNARRTIYHPNLKKRNKWLGALHYLMNVRSHAWRTLHPPTPIHQVVVGHLAMWLCIHGKEGAWNANTGNGYLGGLQMTPGWGGVSRPDLLSSGEQIALAERGYAASGYSISWLRSQWPNTSYGCV